MDATKDKLREWAELRLELEERASAEILAQFDKALAGFQKLKAITLLRDNGVSLYE